MLDEGATKRSPRCGTPSQGQSPDKVAEELGDLLFSVVQAARHLGVDPEAALREANAKFERRFRDMEARLAADGRTVRDSDPDALEALWALAKRSVG